MSDSKNDVSASRSRGRGRPVRALLNQDVITSTALDVVAQQRNSEFTVSELAKRLGVSPSAMYNHAPSKEVILLWMQDALNSTITVAQFENAHLREALEVWAHSYRDAYAKHPGLISVMAWQPIANAPHTIAMYETVASAFVRHGFAPADALDAIVALESFLFGSALDTAAPDDIFDIGEHTEVAPTFAAALSARDERSGRGRASADAAFERGLAALLDGLLS